MSYQFFTPALKSMRLSPFFVFQAACGLSIAWDTIDILRKGRLMSDLEFVSRLMLIHRYIRPSLRRILLNYDDYLRASELMKKYGYREKWANFFIDSTCGRQQLKMASREQNQIEAYRRHLTNTGTRWYHIDSSKCLSLGFGFDFFATMGLTMLSRWSVNMERKPDEKRPVYSRPKM